MRASLLFSALVLPLLLVGCESAYYGGMEKFGIHKRDILVDRVEEAQQAQRDGQQQFRSALEQFRSVVQVDGGELESVYDRLDDEYQRSVAAAERIRSRIDGVESVAKALFDEWQGELDQYADARLRADSAARLSATRAQYGKLIAAMRAAERRLDPALKPMRDQVLYLKHNLNARAIGALKGELTRIDRDVDTLVAAMEQSIREADRFIGSMQQGR